MNTLMNRPQQPDLWYREPWVLLVFGGPALVVVACGVTLYLALHFKDPLVSENYYRDGVRINQHLAEQREAARLADGAAKARGAAAAASAAARH